MRVAFLVHGYPPRENAGTEQYARRVAEGLVSRGAHVRIIVSAPRPGARMYAVEDDGVVLRIANNAPYAGIRSAHADRTLAGLASRALAAFHPDVIHVQHLHAHAIPDRLDAPVVWTLHDAWAWCAAGGLLLRDGAPCAGPSAACPSCASKWVRDPPAVEAALRTASLVGRVVTPDRLHALYQHVPARLRARVSGAPAAPVTAAHLSARDRAIRAFAARCAARLAPSRWLARAAEAQGLGKVDVLPHGVDAPDLPPRTGDAPDAPFVFLGTLAPHKGPDLVVEAHRRSGVTRPLRLYGPSGPDAAFAARFAARPLAQEEVWRALRGARALVMGSRWPENAPLVILEARAAACPVVAPTIGGIPELLTDGRDGRTYAPGDVDALAACMRAIDTDVPAPAAPPSFATHLDGLAAVYTRAVAEAP